VAVNYNEISEALTSVITSIPDMPPIQKENERYVPQIGNTYIRLLEIPGIATGATIGVYGTDQINGLFSINCYFRSNIGIADSNDLVSTIVNAYNQAETITINNTCVRVNSAWKLASTTEADWYQVPIQISWTTFYNRV